MPPTNTINRRLMKCHQLHHPPTRTRKWRAGTVSTHRCDHFIFRDVAVVGEQAPREASASTVGDRFHHVGADQQIRS